jgi:hypothetical protein
MSLNNTQRPLYITVNHLEASGRNRPALTFFMAVLTMHTKGCNFKLPEISFVEFICGFRLLLLANKNRFSKHEPTNVCNGAAVCFLEVRIGF